jgi:putative membrane-bound dehydrogenase-like protein
MRWFPLVSVVSLSLVLTSLAQAEEFIPRRQDKLPGPPVPAEEAAKKMTVPDGFTVEVVAAEPDIVNPVAMTIDERGRFWITESFEYPRHEPGPGRDRVKVAEDTNGDGKADKFTVFAEGLNIPSGIAVGHGGVWVANAPDILFLQDTDGDGKADKQEVVVTGFGRTDTHELPNSLTWGPDGWLYGLNGVFNYCHVKYPKTSPHYRDDHPGWAFTCAMFRIHPRTREFQVFCEGTSNPWGIAWDTEGSAFISACVIDHLWHLTETGYYHRQGGPYPPHTWKIESIVKHKHQAAAYCGIHYFDSDAYPEQYRNKLYMGNIHGGCINSDKLQRAGSSYFATGEPDFLTANDVWFMPVVQKTGPDGSLYILDWYDRYHCYQDANRDPQGVDRLKGRLYRVRYKETPRVARFDMSQESDDELIGRLAANNDYTRHTAQRVLAERLLNGGSKQELVQKLERIALNREADRKQRLHSVWSLLGGGYRDEAFLNALLADSDATLRSWGVRTIGDLRNASDGLRTSALAKVDDESVDVKLQVAIAAPKLLGADAVPVLLRVLESAGDDGLIPHIVWQNLHPLLESQSNAFVAEVAKRDLSKSPQLAAIMPRAIDRTLSAKKADLKSIAAIFDLLVRTKSPDVDGAKQCLAVLAERVQSGEINQQQLAELKAQMSEPVEKILSGDAGAPLFFPAAALAASWKDEAAMKAMSAVFRDSRRPNQQRLQALNSLISANSPALVDDVSTVIADRQANSPALRGSVLSALGSASNEALASIVVQQYPRLEADLKPRAIELLTQRKAWAKQLVAHIGDDQIPASAVNANQIRKLQTFGDAELDEAIRKHFGTVRTDRDPAREAVIAEMRKLIRGGKGDPHSGKTVFTKVCGQCHKMHGEGQEVGPDITANGRGTFEQLLSNVFDPSLVIGASYQARTVLTADGRVLSGLLVEDNDQRIVLKGQGGKLETIARDDVDEMKVSPLSLMPEKLETQLQPQEIVDLFAYITLDKPPTDPTARLIPGTIEPKPRQVSDPKQFAEVLAEVLPGWSTDASGEGGVAVVAEHGGRPFVLRTHPVAQDKACVLTRTVEIPAGKKARLLVAAGHHPEGDWQLVVKANGEKVYESTVGPKTASNGWHEASVDLSKFAGKSVKLELLNQPSGWSWEFGFWGHADIVME